MVGFNKDTYKKWIVPFFYSVVFIPRTYLKIFKNIFFLKEEKNDLITALSNDGRALTLPWYMKTARMYKKYGGKGYYFEEALGMPFSGRFWFDFVSTSLYDKFKYRRVILFSLICILVQFFVMSFYSSNMILGIIFLFFLIPSPLFTRSMLIYGKPEIIAWILFPSLFWFVLEYPHPVFGLIAITISVLNFTVSLFVISFISIAVLFQLIPLMWGTWLIPILFFVLFRILPFYKHFGVTWLFENIKGTRKNTKTSHNKRVKYGIYNYFYNFLVLLSFLIHAYSENELIIIMIGFFVVFSHFLNNKIVRYADNNTLYRLYIFSMGSLFLIFPNIFASITYLFVGYFFLSYCLIVEKEDNVMNPEDYPNITPVNLKDLRKYTLDVFSFACDGDRIAYEVHGLNKFFSGFRVILGFWEYCLNPKGVEFIPSEWMRSTCTDYMISDYKNFNDSASKEQVLKVCRDLGLSHVMAYSKKFCGNLESWGFISIGVYESKQWKNFGVRKVFFSNHNLKIYRVPLNDNGLIFPVAKMSRQGNSIKIHFSKNVNYILRYNYYDGWKSKNNNINIYPKNTNGLNFVGLTSSIDGEATIYYKY